MRYIADLHIHSKYSRACSKNLTLSNLAAWARVKGIDVLATADFTHPAWLKDIETKLEPAEQGLFRLKAGFDKEDGEGNYIPAPAVKDGRDMRFVLSTELCCIYKKNGKTRRNHLVVLSPTIEAVRKMVAYLEAQGRNLKSDGRPILGMDAKEIVKMALDADERCEVIPAHAWTPWFSVFGSQSGFDSLEECFDELTPHIHAVETGVSSDPPMNWRLSELDRVVLVSNSDAHGLRNLAREANVFEFDGLSYDSMLGAIREHDAEKFRYTIEFFPEEGKYHADGHRNCKFTCEPEETERLGGKCPKCGKPLTRGVLGRVHALADRKEGVRPKASPDFRHIIPLEELIADAIGKTKAAKAVFTEYTRLVEGLGPEFDILLDVSPEDIARVTSERIGEAVRRMRSGEVIIRPGYDGEYGKINAFADKKAATQVKLEI
ncbi:MAG: endonuclease Q family protein [Patescibacteria group bacterium]|nr:endonuclease Q family protein [Patescibacteria group bacterium]